MNKKNKKDIFWSSCYNCMHSIALLSTGSTAINIPQQIRAVQIAHLPYWLAGTILDGNTRVIVTEDGIPPEDVTPADYDYVISFAQEDAILSQARQAYIARYGIDPYQMQDTSLLQQQNPQNTQVQISTLIFNILSLPENGMYDVTRPGDTRTGGPHQFLHFMTLRVFYARDSTHRPTNLYNLKQQTRTGWQRFTTFNIIPMIQIWYGYWSAQGVDNDIWNLISDFTSDCSLYKTCYNQVLLGWVKTSNHNGGTYCPSFYVVCAESCWPDAPKDILVQHELTHAIGAINDDPSPDTYIGWHLGGFNPCLVNYFWMYAGTNTWCTTCHNIMHDQIWS